MTAGKPTWTTSTFLVYSGGLTVLGAAIAATGYLSTHYHHAGMAAWAAYIYVVLYTIAYVFRRRERAVAAGIFAFAAVIAWGAFLGFCWQWFGWLKSSSSFGDFSFARLSLEFLVLVAALDARRRFRFPFIRLISALLAWLFVIDLITGGGNWTATVTLIVGLLYLLAGTLSDRPSAFWLHLVGGALIGGSLIYWAHSGDGDWALISIASLAYVLIAYATKRSSWAVLGTLGFFAATVHFVLGSPLSGLPERSIAGWAPSVAFACLGFWIVLLGLLARRRAE
jgi:hypothetical protein